MEFIGTFSHVGRPIDAIRFEVINGNQIKYQSIGTDAIQMPVQSIVKVNQDPHPDYFRALDKLASFAIETLDLGKNWKTNSSIGSLKLEWTYSNQTEKFSYKIAEITIARSSSIEELCIPRIIKFGGIVADEIPWDVKGAIDDIMDEAWLYCAGKKTAQLDLFDTSSQIESKPAVDLDDMRSYVRKALNDRGIYHEIIDAYLEEDGEEISVKGFYDWFEDDDQLMTEPNIEALNETIADLSNKEIESIAKPTRSKSRTKKQSA